MNGADATPALSPTLGVRVEGDTVRFVLQVTNVGEQPVRLEFASGQRYDFAVVDGAGAEVWRWSAGMGFVQMIGLEELAPGATLGWEEVWAAGGRSGTFEAVAWLTSTTRPLELRTPFELTGG